MAAEVRTLVTPDRRIYRFQHESQLDAWCTQHNIGWKLKGNLKQLLGWKETRNASTRWEAEDYFRLEHGRETWLSHPEIPHATPLFGDGAKKLKQLQQLHPVAFSRTRWFAFLGDKVSRDGWVHSARPNAVARLDNGGSLLQLAACSVTVAAQLPDFAASALGALAAHRRSAHPWCWCPSRACDGLRWLRWRRLGARGTVHAARPALAMACGGLAWRETVGSPNGI